MLNLQTLLGDLQTILIDEGAMTSPVKCGQIILNVNEGRVASVHINAVVRIQGKPKEWHIPMRSGVLKKTVDTAPALSVK